MSAPPRFVLVKGSNNLWRLLELLKLHEPPVYRAVCEPCSKGAALMLYRRLVSGTRETRVINPLEDD